MNIRTYAGIVTGLLLISIAFHIWTYRENSDNSSRHALDREVLIKGNAHLKSELKLRDSVVLAIQNDRTADSAEHAAKQGSLKTQINGLKSKVRQLASVSMLNNANQIVVLQDSVIVADSLLITDLENERDSIRMSYQEEIRILGQSRLALETAYDSTFNQLLTVNDALIVSENKLTRMEKIAKALGISTGTLAVITTVLLIAL